MEHLTRDIATLLGLAAIIGYINHRFLHLPRTIGLVLIAMAASLIALGIDALIPGWGVGPGFRAVLVDIDFSDTLMQGMLGFLLFAGALHVDLGQLAKRGWAIAALATGGLLFPPDLLHIVSVKPRIATNNTCHSLSFHMIPPKLRLINT